MNFLKMTDKNRRGRGISGPNTPIIYKVMGLKQTNKGKERTSPFQIDLKYKKFSMKIFYYKSFIIKIILNQNLLNYCN